MSRNVYFENIESILAVQDSESSEGRDYRKDLRLRLLRSLLDTNLTKKQKCYIMLYYKENKKICEIAEQFGVLPSTVSRTINRARKKLFKAVTGRELYIRYTNGK